MCGILGIYNSDDSPVDPRVLKSMIGMQRHRGPDSLGAWLFSIRRRESQLWDPGSKPAEEPSFEGALGFNRLSILDLSANGNQPMSGRGGRISIVFNGEIYNAFDYKPELEKAGHRLGSGTDTEVVLRLYEHLVFEGMLARLHGMFALCIIDLDLGSLLGTAYFLSPSRLDRSRVAQHLQA